MVLEMEMTTRTRRTREPIKVDFSKIEMRSRDAKGFKVTSYPVTSDKVVSRGKPTESPSDSDGAGSAEDGGADGNGPSGAENPSAESTGASDASAVATEGSESNAAANAESDAVPTVPSAPSAEAEAASDSDKIQRDGPKRMFQLSFFDDES